MSVVALVIAPSIAMNTDTMMAYNEGKVSTEMVQKQLKQETIVEMDNMEDGSLKATVTTTSEVNGEVTNEIKEFTGVTKEEVNAKVEAYNESISTK